MAFDDLNGFILNQRIYARFGLDVTESMQKLEFFTVKMLAHVH